MNETENQHILSTRILAEIAIFVALATALSLIIIYQSPQGGSITLASMVPILWLALRRGTVIGLFAGIVYGLIQFAILPFIAPSPYAIIQVMLDYPLAFGVLGLAGLFQKRPLIGVTLGIALRFILHFVAGVIFWAPVIVPELDPYVYSAAYNGSYLLPELIISGVIIYLLQKSNSLRAYL